MSKEPTPAQEPSIEEILDSIRQIISDEEAPETAAAAPPPAPAASTPEASPPFQSFMNDDVIELTDKVEDEAVPAPAVMPEPGPAPEAAPADERPPEKPLPAPAAQDPVAAHTPEPAEPEARAAEHPPIHAEKEHLSHETKNDTMAGILTKNVETTVMNAFSELTQKAEIQRGGGMTIEDIVREEIRPHLMRWLDKNLPQMVERLLQKELERISRRVESD